MSDATLGLIALAVVQISSIILQVMARRLALETHSLVNSAFESQQKIAALALRRIADLTGHPEDKAAADMAARAVRSHAEAQSKVDNKKGI